MKRMTFNEQVGKNLRDLRLEHNLSMRDLAERLGTTSTKICRIENGGVKLSLEDAIRIADLFDISLDKLVEQI